MNYNRFKTYGKSLALRRGMRILTNLTFLCNQKCEYCNMILPTGKVKTPQLTLEDWKGIIGHFTSIHKVREVQVSGGEPTLVKWMPEFVRWLLGKGFHVLILSNGCKVERILEIPKSYRLQVSMTYHHGEVERDEMTRRYNLLRSRGYRVNIKEIRGHGEKEYKFSWPSVRLCRNADDLLLEDKTFPMLNFGPNGQLYDGCHSMYLDLAIPKEEQK